MRSGFFFRLAFDSMRKNSRLYKPYFFTCTLMVAVFYILSYLSASQILEKFPGSYVLMPIMKLGSFVIAVFALLFLFYTNSFLMRRRRREFGLYNILGMDRHSICRILMCETLTVCVLSIALGLIAGIAFSKLAELILLRAVGGAVDHGFAIPAESVKYTVIIFPIIFLLIFLRSLAQLHFSSPAELIHSENFGEKPPKANWLLGLAGFVILAFAYYIAVAVSDPIEAMAWFFIAVIMVIAATYLIFIAGSVLMCRLLQKSKSYYYKKEHFVSVSSMVYRMKRNGAGLASICILLTMVLVIISSTASLYFGKEDSLRTRYPRDISFRLYFTDDLEGFSADNITCARDAVSACIRQSGADIKSPLDYRCASISGLLYDDGRLCTDVRHALDESGGVLTTVCLIPLEDYISQTGGSLSLSPGEAIACALRLRSVPENISIGTFGVHVSQVLSSLETDGELSAQMSSVLYLIVPDFDSTVAALSTLTDYNNDIMLDCKWNFLFDTALAPEAHSRLASDIAKALDASGAHYVHCSYECLAEDREDFYSTYGGLFFLGIMLSAVFIAAAVLIIYYKQMSEGYEDKARFEIMQNVGMSTRDIKRSINSQVLTVFYLPIVFAVLHMGFAFPMIRKILFLFNLTNLRLFLITTGISAAVFSVAYALVYRMTSSAYYAIVSGSEKQT